jgi:hypothetical protein
MQTGATGAELEIQHEERDGQGAFYVPGPGGRLAELTYAHRSGEAAVIEHTTVSGQLAGQGVGKRLVEVAVDWARRTGTKVRVECPFARVVIDRNPSLKDVLA